MFGNRLGAQEREEIGAFLTSRGTLRSRLAYISRSKLYRQKKWQTALFKALYVSGGYNTD
jgi:hypothetical protein